MGVGAFDAFFTRVAEGRKGQPSQIPAYGNDLFAHTFARYASHFDAHIGASIPGYRQAQFAIGRALIRTFGGGRMLDIGASTGAQAKTIAALSDLRLSALEPNRAMRRCVAKDCPAGVTLCSTDGLYDVVQEAMTFQFISPDRRRHIAQTAARTRKNGLAIVQEKVITDAFDSNERLLAEKKRAYFDDRQIQGKRATVDRMRRNMVSQDELEKRLRQNFTYVEPIWESGNFKGYAATHRKAIMGCFLNAYR